MSETLLSVGLDVGTTTTQMILSRLLVENRAGGFAVPRMEIVDRKILYESPVRFTPLIRQELVDGQAIREWVETEYARAGIRRGDVDTGAIIITGETSRKENARTVLDAISEYAGEFVVATAGPDLESVLAARGAGAVELSRQTGKAVLHMDIGGGTSNLCWIEDGQVVATGCLNVGGRLIKLDESGAVTYVSPVLEKLCKLKTGQVAETSQIEEVAALLVQALEMAAGLREATELLQWLWTREAGQPKQRAVQIISFSGGVADCIERERPWLAFGDMGPELGRAIRESKLCRGAYVLGRQTIRATVIGAGCHSTQLSGSTVFCRNVDLPVKNLAVVTDPVDLTKLDSPGVLALPGEESPGYDRVRELAKGLAGQVTPPVIIALEADMAKALGQALALELGMDAGVLCIDRVKLGQGDYLDVGRPAGPALPVVVKTLVLSPVENRSEDKGSFM